MLKIKWKKRIMCNKIIWENASLSVASVASIKMNHVKNHMKINDSRGTNSHMKMNPVKHVSM